LASGGEEDFSVQQELPPTLRIHASQAAPAPHLLQLDKVPAAAAPFRPPEPAPAPAPEPELRVPPKQAEPATTVAASPEGEEPAGIGGSTAPFPSSTLAELYFQQGLVDRAVDVYRQLVTQQPGNDRARSRLAELEQAEPPADARAARRQELQRTIAGLEALLAVVRRR
jgi:hypothetical protein